MILKKLMIAGMLTTSFAASADFIFQQRIAPIDGAEVSANSGSLITTLFILRVIKPCGV